MPIDYFMKWVEAEALATIKEVKIQNFMWKNIVCRFEIPRMIISVRKFRPRLIELTSFKSKLLIRSIINKTC